MTLQSMTGFARSEGTSGRYRWAWELRSVNGKGLDVRLRLPSGMEGYEAEAKRLVSEKFSRGNLQVSLTVSVAETRIEAVLNRDALAAVLALREEIGPELIDMAPMKLDTLMGIRGLVELQEAPDSDEAVEAREAVILAGLADAVDSLRLMREGEGEALKTVLAAHVDRIEELTRTVEQDPSRTPAEIIRKLESQISALIDSAPSLDRDRLHMEAALLATKADLREEIDRLNAHVSAARELLEKGGPIGRKLDFLAQEFNRESNTICSKSNSVAVTAAGIELKVVIDQFREQVQNLE
ncbi:YicC family protein [Ciceribacter sp. L1K23]|uniref:YicC/YloC family endoribonuclease n=1 Tax=unclassified Ciceribacter TaxID=2628820 RepID=UPI001ABDCAEE|nr:MULTISPECIES: YicC/YloC family endoribonuclease [unclassified Ciceribacter]MBO3759695.1 YicC family protein [Ciceribacter sp. L1K22]MBR0556149.1 YicC family protein [Ciceribacter sp. L1K23]